jgi:hypothetical protein
VEAAVNRLRMIIAVGRLAKPTLVEGFYVTSDAGEPYPAEDFCREHADVIAREHQAATGVISWVASTSMGSDGHRECAFKGCRKHLDFGELTDYGIDSALGLTERDPHNVSVYWSELKLAADSMMPNDPRWALWERHAKRKLRRFKLPRAQRRRRR